MSVSRPIRRIGVEPARTGEEPRDREREDGRGDGVEAGVVPGAIAPVGDPRRAEAVPAQLEGRGDVDGAIERAGEEPPGELRLPDRGGTGAAQLRRIAESRGVGGGHRHQPRDQARGQCRASRDRPQGAEDAVGIDAGRVDGEGDEDDERAEAEDDAFDDRLGGDVDPAEYRPVAEPGDHRLAAVDDDRVDDDDQQRERQPHPERGPNGAPGPGQDAGADGRHSHRDEDDRARVEEGDRDQRAEVGDRGPG